SGTGGRHWRWNGLGRRWSIPERAVRPDGVVMPPPSFDQDLGLGERVEDLSVEQFITQRSVEAFAIAILPWRSGRDVERLHADLGEPLLNRLRDKLRAIVRPYMRGRPTHDEQLGEGRQHVIAPELACDRQRQALPARLVDDRQDPVFAPIMSAALDEVVGPDMAGIFRS